MTDVLKKPVHVALLRKTQIAELAESGRIQPTPFGIDPNEVKQPLPVEQKPVFKPNFPKMFDVAKASKRQVQLKVVYDRLPPIPADKTPPCDSCKTAPCCRVFVVNLDPVEYESGLFGDAAVKLTAEMYQQLQSPLLTAAMLLSPRDNHQDVSYFLEGRIGEPCPFLDENNRCGIYDIRPRTCRMYPCVGDSRITEGMRQGTEPVDAMSLLKKIRKDA